MDRNFLSTLESSKLKSQIGSMLADARKYFAPDGWTVTENVHGVDRLSLSILAALCAGGDGGRRSAVQTIRLKVLTRQAVSADAAGNIINGSLTGCSAFEMRAPAIDSPAIEGDIIVVKQNPRDKSDNGKDMTPEEADAFEKRHMHEPYRWRDYLRHEYNEYQVDADGCVNVTPTDAIYLLKRRGENVVFPKFRTQPTQSGRPSRVITNWFFREVPPDYTDNNEADEPEVETTKPTPRKARKPAKRAEVDTVPTTEIEE
jgi:hypothetical protein